MLEEYSVYGQLCGIALRLAGRECRPCAMSAKTFAGALFTKPEVFRFVRTQLNSTVKQSRAANGHSRLKKEPVLAQSGKTLILLQPRTRTSFWLLQNDLHFVLSFRV